MNDQSVKFLDVVALLIDLPEKKLRRGQVGTAVEPLAEGVFEIEFADKNGQAYAFAAVKSSDLMVLHHAPVEAVAV